MLGLIGGLIGAAVAVVAGLVVLARQFETFDERHLRTVRQLLEAVKTAAKDLNSEPATLDPRRYVEPAFLAYQSARSVTRELQAAGPNIATVTQMLDESVAWTGLIRLRNRPADAGIGLPDMQRRGNEAETLADAALDKLKEGL